ncbi:MAG TPA: OmpA family protein [Candidatus Baltobacteraceae bacterium]|nr:OmpA family protein [Candidatus Baltobacteraceae bacterium]
MNPAKLVTRVNEERQRSSLRKQSHGGSNENAGGMRWLLTYADMITLMMALFVILFAMSTPSHVKFQAFAKSVSGGFDNDWAVNNPPNGGRQTQAMGGVQSGGYGPQANHPKESSVLQIPEIQSQLNSYIRQQHLEHSLQLHLDSRGLVITLLSDNAYYSSGSAELRPQTQRILDHVSAFLKRNQFLVRVEGNTDNVPIHTAEYPTNWELSTARATNVARYLVERDGMDPHRLGATGYGEWRARYPNDTPGHRAANRRVDIVILNAKLSQLMSPPLPY